MPVVNANPILSFIASTNPLNLILFRITSVSISSLRNYRNTGSTNRSVCVLTRRNRLPVVGDIQSAGLILCKEGNATHPHHWSNMLHLLRLLLIPPPQQKPRSLRSDAKTNSRAKQGIVPILKRHPTLLHADNVANRSHCAVEKLSLCFSEPTFTYFWPGWAIRKQAEDFWCFG